MAIVVATGDAAVAVAMAEVEAAMEEVDMLPGAVEREVAVVLLRPRFRNPFLALY